MYSECEFYFVVEFQFNISSKVQPQVFKQLNFTTVIHKMKSDVVKFRIVQSPEKCFLNLDFLNSPNKDIQPIIAVTDNYWLFSNNDYANFEEPTITNDCKVEYVFNRHNADSNSIENSELHVKPFNYSVFADDHSDVSIAFSL